MKIIQRFVLSALIIIFFIGANNLFAGEKTFVIGVEDNLYFPHYTYQDGEYNGIGREILDAFFTEKNYKYKFKALPVARLFQSFLDGSVDFKYPDNAFWSVGDKQGKGVIYSNPVMPSTDGVMVLPENLGKKTASQIRILGTIRGFTAPQWMGRVERGEMILAENDSSNLLVKQVFAKRIEGAYGNIDVMRFILRNEYSDGTALVFDPSLPHTRDYYYMSSIKYPEVIDEFDAWLKENDKFISNLKLEYKIADHPR